MDLVLPTCPDCAVTLEVNKIALACPECGRTVMPGVLNETGREQITIGDFTAQLTSLHNYVVFGPGSRGVGVISPLGHWWAAFRTHPLTSIDGRYWGEWRHPEYLGATPDLDSAVALFNRVQHKPE